MLVILFLCFFNNLQALPNVSCDGFMCKFSKICIEIAKKCDDIVDCCNEGQTDQSDESDCGTILMTKPPSVRGMLENHASQINYNILQNYTTDDYSSIWFINGVKYAEQTFQDSTYGARLTDTDPKQLIFTILSPQLNMNSSELMLQIIDRKRIYENVCGKKASIMGSHTLKFAVYKKPSFPNLYITQRHIEDNLYNKPISFGCELKEGYMRPKILWLYKDKTGAMRETEGHINKTLGEKIQSLISIENPARYIGTSIVCKSVYTFENETLVDATIPNILAPVSLQHLSAEGQITLKTETSLNLTCQFNGYPFPVIRWIYSKRPINIQPGVHNQDIDVTSNIKYITYHDINQNDAWTPQITQTKTMENNVIFYERNYLLLDNLTINYNGYFLCIGMNELGQYFPNPVQLIIPDPALGPFAQYFITKESFTKFIVVFVISFLVFCVLFYLSYRKISAVISVKRKIYAEQAAEAKRKADEARKFKRGPNSNNKAMEPGMGEMQGPVKRLKGPPPLTDSEKPFISVMDQALSPEIQEQQIKFDCMDKIRDATMGNDLFGAPFDTEDAPYEPPIAGQELLQKLAMASKHSPDVNNGPNINMSGTKSNSGGGLDFKTEFQYPDDDDAVLLNILKK